MRAAIAKAALAVKKISDTTLREIIATIIPPPESGLRAAHSVLLVSVGAGIADVENFKMLNPGGGPKLENIALMRFQQRPRDRRYPTHLATIEIGLVNADDGDRSHRSPLMSIGDGRAKEHLIQVFLLCRLDHLGDLQPLGKKAYSPIDLA